MVLYRLGKSSQVFRNDDIKAVKYFFESLKYSEKLRNLEYTSKSYNYLGIVFYANHKYEDAIVYFNKALKSQWNDEHGFRSIPYYLSGLCQFELKRYPLALENFNQALLIIKNKPNKEDREHEIELGIAKVMIATKQYDKAKKLISKTLDYYRKRNVFVAMAVAYNLSSRISLAEKKYPIALEQALTAYNYINGAINSSFIRLDIAQQLHDVYYAMGDITSAHKYLLEVQKIKDEAVALDITSQIALTYAQYQNDLERNTLQLTIQRQKEENRKAIIAVAILGGLFLVIGFLLLFVRKERQKSEKLIRNILPTRTIEQLKKHGKALPERHENDTVMFCDVKEFSNMAAQLKPEILINILDFYFSNFDRIITSYANIEKIKTIGDAYLCASGLQYTDNHALNMVSAANEILQFVEQTKKKVIELFGHSVEFRVGIHSGSLISGVVGTHKYAYDIWGDTVNLAARMETSSEPGRINVSHATYELVKDYFSFEKRGIIEVKNGLKLEVYYLTGSI